MCLFHILLYSKHFLYFVLTKRLGLLNTLKRTVCHKASLKGNVGEEGCKCYQYSDNKMFSFIKEL